MAANSTATKQTTQARTTAPKQDEKGIDSAVAYVRQTAERAVDVPVGVAVTVAESVKPWTEPTGRDKELKQLRTQVSRELNKLERRGGQARRKATTRVRGTRNRVERELKQRRNRVERTVKQRRTAAERTVKQNRTKVEKAVKDVQTAVQERVGVGATQP